MRWRSLIAVEIIDCSGERSLISVEIIDCGGEQSLIAEEIIDCSGDGEDWSSAEDCKGEEAKCAQVIDCYCFIATNNNNNNNNKLILAKMSPGVMKAD